MIERYARNKMDKIFLRQNKFESWKDIQKVQGGLSFRERVENDPRAKLEQTMLGLIFESRNFLKQTRLLFNRLRELEF